MTILYLNAAVMTPQGLEARDIHVRDGRIAAFYPSGEEHRARKTMDLQGQLVTPPMCDLQVNGGGGLMLGACQSVEDLRQIVDAHQSDGVAHILPTLISDTEEQIIRIADLVAAARRDGLWQIQGLHLEGPHLTRAGAHDPDMFRPLEMADLALYREIAAKVGRLMITLAPELVPVETIAELTRAGIIVALGHSECDSETAWAAFDAGAHCATHLFNAMSGLDHRHPGLAAAALARGTFGLIADGIHVHPDMLRLAGRHHSGAFLVSDAMAVAGTDLDQFHLNGRRIERRDGRLTLEDGTLAGADLTLARAVDIMTRASGLPRVQVISMATQVPAALLGQPKGLTIGRRAVFQAWPTRGKPRLHLPDGWTDQPPLG